MVKKLRRSKVEVNVPMSDLVAAVETLYNDPSKKAGHEQLKEKLETITSNLSKRKGNYKIDLDHWLALTKKLPNGKQAGPRGITNEAIKYSSPTVISLIGLMLEMFINNRHLPNKFNMARVFPIIKNEKASNTDINNTRNISVSDVCANLFEQVILDEINKSLDESELQFGFRQNYSCSHAVFCAQELLKYNKKRNKIVYG